MIINVLLLAIFAAVTGLLVRAGLWRAVLGLLNVLLAASIATAWFGPLAGLLGGYLPSFKYLVDFLSLWLIFCLVLVVARAVVEAVTPNEVEFPQLVERIGVGIPAAFAGWVVMAFAAATLHTAPVPRDMVQPTPEARLFFGSGADRKWLSWVRNASRSGPFSRPDAAFDTNADFILRYADHRRRLEAEETLLTAAE